MRLLLALVLASFVIAVGTGNAAKAANQTLKLAMPDGPREAILLQAERAGPNPTIIILHSATLSAQRMVRSSGFAEAAAVHGFTAVFPEGKQQLWNADAGSRKHTDDIGFLNALAHQLIDAKIADPARLYLAGVANGGMMAFTTICNQDSLFAGVATIVAALPANLEQSCRPPKPLAVIMMNGTADPILPFHGGHAGFFGRHRRSLGVERTAEIFAKAEACTGKTEAALPKRNKGETTHVNLVTWNGCAPGSSVHLYEVEGGGHQIPGGPTILPFLFGNPNHDIRAANEILRLFSGS